MSALWAEFLSAVGLLTRLPLPRIATPEGAGAAWAWPLVGVIVGSIAAVAASALLVLGVPATVAAAALLATQALLTGALHEDGLADTADGFFGGWTVARRLEIMKDSHIGSYGTLALILTVLARWSALCVLLTGPLWGVIAVAALSRAPMAVLMAALPNARGTGLAQSVGRPERATAWVAVGLAMAIAMVLAGFWAALAMSAVLGMVTLWLAWTALARIGGQTGDVLGAAQQLAEMAALVTLAAFM